MSKLLSLKKLKSAMSQNMPMKEFFMSGTFRYHFNGIIKMVSERYGNASIFFVPSWGGDYIAFTDNRKIHINFDNELEFGIKDLEKRYLMNLGFLGHELGHVLYTDFNQSPNWQEAFLEGNFYGDYDEKYQNTVKEILNYKDDGVICNFLFQVYHNLSNILEDSYVNAKISREFPGTFKNALKLLHSIQFKDEMEETDEELSTLMNILLTIVVGHKTPAIARKYSKQISEMKNIVKNIESQDLIADRLKTVNNTYLYLWPTIKKVIDEIKDMEKALEQMSQSSDGGQSQDGESGQSQSNNGGQSQDGENSQSQSGKSGKSQSSESQNGDRQVKKVLKQIQKSSEEGKGTGVEAEKQQSSQNGSSKDSSNSSSNKTGGRNTPPERNGDAGNKRGKKNSENSDKNGKDGEGKKPSNDGTSENGNSSESGDSSENGDSSDNGTSENGTSGDDASSEDGNFEEVPADVQFEGNTGSEGATQNALDALLSDFAKEVARKNPDVASQIMATALADDITSEKGSCHNGFPCRINTVKSYDDRKSDYNMAAKELLPISRRLQKSVGALLENKLDGGCLKNLLKGNKINPAASASRDGRIFKRNQLPEEQDLAVSLLIDESGSMCGSRIQKALETAIIIEDFCAGLGVPVSITGHRETGTCEIDEFIRFDDNSKNRRFNLTRLSAGGCNRDGLALRYCIKNLLQRDEENKLMIIISDGRPNSSGYYGAEAARDLFSAKREFEKKGGKLIAAAIGDDKPTIQEIYRDSFLDITDLNSLPMKMVKLISAYLKD